MAKLSDKDVSASISGGYIHIIMPDPSAETGFKSYRAKLEDFISAGGATWGSIIGTLENQTDLQDVLDTIPAAQIQSDWNQSNNALLDFIKNKPPIPAAQIQSDWNQVNNTLLDFIKNKPSIPNLSTVTYHIEVALAQLDKDITVKTGVAVFPCPEDLTLQSVFIRFGTAPTGANVLYDINVAGSTILSTRITVEAGENSSLDATTQPVISSANIDRGAAITVDCDQIGATVAGQNPVLVMTYVKR
jgi:hypothetical protein